MQNAKLGKSAIGIAAGIIALAMTFWAIPAYAAGYTASSLNASSVSSQATMSMFGVDVSVHNGTINWATTSKNVNFAILRCGYGNDMVSQDDKQWINNVRGCRNNGVPIGVYIYSYATNTSMAQSEANHVIRCLRNAGLNASTVTLPIYYDMEDKCMAGLSNAQLASLFNTFRSTLVAAGYSKIGIYSSSSWWEYKLTDISINPQYRWVAHWGVSAPGNGYPKTKAAGCGIWQYSSTGSVPGIPTRVDVNRGNNSAPFFFNQNVGGYELKVFRMYYPRSGEHLYTTDSNECAVLSSRHGWVYEGVAWTAPRYGTEVVYRLYHPRLGDHLYTTDTNEVRVLTSGYGWRNEGTAFYADPTSSKRIMRVYHPRLTVGSHHFTLDANEVRVLTSRYGWRNEGYAWHVL